MSHSTLLLIAALLAIGVGIAHSLLGEMYLLTRLFRRPDLPTLFGSTASTVRTLRFAWHITTIAWWGFAAMLWLASRDALTQDNALVALAITMLATAATILVASRGKHMAWPVFVAITAAAFYAPTATSQDHPLVSAYAGSTVDSRKVEEFGEYRLVTGRDARGEFTGETLNSRLTRIVYRNPVGHSTLEIFSNYQTALAGAIASDKGTAYVAVMVGRQRSQVGVIEITGMQEGMVVVDAAALGRGLDRDGRVSVYGIYFDTDKSGVKPESKAALVTSYGVAVARLEGHGVGPLAPVASNAEESGRAKNRRVELVTR